MFTRSIFRQASAAARIASPAMAMARPAVATRSFMPAAFRFYSVKNTLTEGSPALAYASEKPLVRYTEEHEWIALHKDNVAFIGITKYAADALGDATYIEVSDVGEEIEPNGSLGSVESVKSASDLYSPVTGEIIEKNEGLIENPTIVNKDPLGDGWFVKLKVSAPEEVEGLMDIEAYEEFIKSD
ncbi:glycine decarboxylase subunit H [Sugiyamaella lignohabitans]|uniref:Glycine cleavage system H protein n=1 Tax=Sugiyamaella lignohabitans TaxID=796027 RepID=A0A167DEL6_9ASCO|nr:glycine decarboxylase subunit H [Sugiyamaella lignohabitans]ANB12829.1 glycine decarboxylase subunit H [Sugiyamaella lignohabitans]